MTRKVMAPHDSIAVVVPVFNQVALTERCLESLLAHSERARELVVVDNASSDATPEALRALFPRFEAAGWSAKVIRNDTNRGFGRACNQGIRATGGEFVTILNNDTWLMPSWDVALIENAKRLNASMLGPHYDESTFEPERMLQRAAKFVSRNKGKVSCDWVSILMFFKRADLERIGLFDERFFVTYEDADLKERMDRAGYKYFQVADCFIWHHSKGTRAQSSMPSGYEAEGLRLFMEKWNFDPRLREITRVARLKRRWKKIKIRLGLF